MKFQVLASGSKGNAYVLSGKGYYILIECGIPLNTLLKKIARLPDAVLVTHEHKDHSKAVKGLASMGVPIYCSYGTAFEAGIYGHHNWEHVQHGISCTIPDTPIYVVGFNVQHDATEPLGFLVTDTEAYKDLLFVTDSANLVVKASPQIAAIECNWDIETVLESVDSGITHRAALKRLSQTHMGLEVLLRELPEHLWLDALEELYIIHTSSRNANKERIKQGLRGILASQIKLEVF